MTTHRYLTPILHRQELMADVLDACPTESKTLRVMQWIAIERLRGLEEQEQ